MDSLFKNASGVISLKNLFGCAAVSLFALGVTACTKSDETAGGVTDIGNSVASGFVVTEGNQPVAHARVVAYYDNWDKAAIEDSVETIADDNGMFSLKFDSTRNVVLYAEGNEGSGLSRIQNKASAHVMVGHPRRLESSIAAANSGYMRIVGSNEMAPVNEDGSFAFASMPVGEISLVYVAGEQPKARFDFMTAVVGDTLVIPSLEQRDQNNGWLTISDYHYYSGAAYGGIMVDVPAEVSVPEPVIVPPDTSAKGTVVNDTTATGVEDLDISVRLDMEGDAQVYNSDGTPADPDSVEYVEGISGKGILLKVGQYVDVGEIDPSAGDFTLSMWTFWKGFRQGSIYQLLFAQRSDWMTSTARFQLQYDVTISSIVAVSDGISATGYAWLSKGNTERGGVLPPNEWANITLVYENGKLFLYVNGELASEPAGVPFKPKDMAEPVPFRIGGTEVANDTWNGIIDEVTIESTARSAEWVKAQYEALAK